MSELIIDKEKVEQFIEKMYNYGYEFLDKIIEDPNFEGAEYDIKITVKDISISLPVCADVYSETAVFLHKCYDVLKEDE